MRRALIICTYRRRRALRQTLRSVAAQPSADALLVIVVEKDAADSLQGVDYPFELMHVPYDGPPSAARQRNVGLDRLPPPVEQVFFLDDDVELEPDYFEALGAALSEHPGIGGAGGVFVDERRAPSTSPMVLLKRLFLLSGTVPGRVLPSGKATPAQLPPVENGGSPFVPTEWLSTCSSAYQRRLLERHRFDEDVPGALLEDLDLSYRVSRAARLVVVPHARLIHHRSERNRPATRAYGFMDTVQRYWFVKKNLTHPLRQPAFWWSVAGRALAVLASNHPQKWSALRGLMQGAWAVLRRDHPLLRGDRAKSMR